MTSRGCRNRFDRLPTARRAGCHTLKGAAPKCAPRPAHLAPQTAGGSRCGTRRNGPAPARGCLRLFALAACVLATAMSAGCNGSRAVFDGRPWLATLDRAEAQADDGRAAFGLALRAKAAAAQLNEYAARFEKQERIGTELRPMEEIDAAVREEPLSVHLKWVGRVDRGKEALYVEDDNDDRVRVWAGHLPAPFAVNAEPDGALAMKTSRHPITHMGLRTLGRGLFQHQGEPSPALPESFRVLGHMTLDGRRVTVIGRRTVTASNDEAPDALVYGIDEANGLPVFVARYGAPPEATASRNSADGADHPGNAPLLEFYCYRNVRPGPLPPGTFAFDRLGK